MKSRLSTILAAAALMIVLTTTPSYAIFGAITGALQRAQMIINQGIQIYEAQIAKLTMDGQLTELTSQFDHLKEQAMGSVGKITQPFTELSSAPAKLIGNGISWKNEFTGVAGEFVSSIEQLGETGTSFTDSWRGRIQGSNTVSETDVLNLYTDSHPEVAARALPRATLRPRRRATNAWSSTMRRVTRREISCWPQGKPLAPTPVYPATPTSATRQWPRPRFQG